MVALEQIVSDLVLLPSTAAQWLKMDRRQRNEKKNTKNKPCKAVLLFTLAVGKNPFEFPGD